MSPPVSSSVSSRFSSAPSAFMRAMAIRLSKSHVALKYAVTNALPAASAWSIYPWSIMVLMRAGSMRPAAISASALSIAAATFSGRGL